MSESLTKRRRSWGIVWSVICGLTVSCGSDDAATGSSVMIKGGDAEVSQTSDGEDIDAEVPQTSDGEDMGSERDDCDCAAPPASTCANGATVQEYVPNTCDDQGVCLSGAFVSIDVACDEPPESRCKDATTVLVTDPGAPGACERGACVYGAEERSCDAPPADTCEGDMVRNYDAQGACEGGECAYPSTLVSCERGCCDGACCDMRTSNEPHFGAPRATGYSASLTAGTFDTDRDCTSVSPFGACIKVDGEASASDACVCYSDALTIADVNVVGSRALVLLASDALILQGTLDVSASTYRVRGPGSLEASIGGSAGGSFGTKGAGGGAETPYGNASLEPLVGGRDGQSSSCVRGRGGSGGGAVQLTALNRIVISGDIHAGGGGGGGGTSSCQDGAGGGAGGGILIEAPLVEITGALAAHGGGGGSGGSTDHSGYDGTDASISWGGGGGARVEDETCAVYGSIYSGEGGRGEGARNSPSSGGSGDRESRCLGEDTTSGSGGGGGGMGRIRINAEGGRSGCLCSGTYSPEPSFGDTGAP